MASAKFLKKVLRFLFLVQTLISHLTFSDQVSVPEYSFSNLSSHILREIEILPESEFRYDSKVIEIVPKIPNNVIHFKFIGNEITQVNNNLQGDLVIPKLGNNTHSSVILLEFHKVIHPKSWKVFKNGLLALWRSKRSSLHDSPNMWNAAVVYPRADKPFYFEWDFLDPAITKRSVQDDNLLALLSLCMQKETSQGNWDSSKDSSELNEVVERRLRIKRGLLSLYRPLHNTPIVSSIVRTAESDLAQRTHRNGTHGHALALASAMVANRNSTRNAEANSVNRVGGAAMSITDNQGRGNATSLSVVDGLGFQNTSSATSVAQTRQGGVASSRSMYIHYREKAQIESSETFDPEAFRTKVDTSFEKIVRTEPQENTEPIEEIEVQQQSTSAVSNDGAHVYPIMSEDPQPIAPIAETSFDEPKQMTSNNESPLGSRRKRSLVQRQLKLKKQMDSFCYKLKGENRIPLKPGKRKPSPEELQNLTNNFLFQAYKLLSNSSVHEKSHEQELRLRGILMDSERNELMSQFEEHRIKLSRILTPVIEQRLKALLLLLVKHEKRHGEIMQQTPQEIQLLKAMLRILSF